MNDNDDFSAVDFDEAGACTEKALANLDRAAAYVRARTSFADPEAWQPRDPLPEERRARNYKQALDAATGRRLRRELLRFRESGPDARGLDAYERGRYFYVLPHGQIYLERLAAFADSAGRVKHWQHFGTARAVLRLSVAPEVLPTMIARGMV